MKRKVTKSYAEKLEEQNEYLRDKYSSAIKCLELFIVSHIHKSLDLYELEHSGIFGSNKLDVEVLEVLKAAGMNDDEGDWLFLFAKWGNDVALKWVMENFYKDFKGKRHQHWEWSAHIALKNKHTKCVKLFLENKECEEGDETLCEGLPHTKYNDMVKKWVKATKRN